MHFYNVVLHFIAATTTTTTTSSTSTPAASASPTEAPTDSGGKFAPTKPNLLNILDP